ncbi:MAG: DUF1326 domain-containing protein [Planctomycetota bacterium]|nr:DUF1326 domain-containing protein [Planctomycetota bacterium]
MIPASLLIPLLSATSAGSTPCVGSYVEARTASVFAGACHYNGEFVTAGREALCAWRIESGAFGGVDLAGVAIVAVVSAEANLDERSAARRSVIHVDAALAPERAAAAVLWLATTRGAVLGTVVEVRADPLAVAIDADSYSVACGAAFELFGAPLPDRACCAMPQNVWYTPFERLDRPLVGLDEAFEVRAPALDRAWSRPGENAAFTGRFGVR